MTWVYCIIGTILDAVLFVIPIWMVRRTMVFDTKAVRVILIFCAGSLAVIAGTVKTVILMTSDLSDDTSVSPPLFTQSASKLTHVPELTKSRNCVRVPLWNCMSVFGVVVFRPCNPFCGSLIGSSVVMRRRLRAIALGNCECLRRRG